MKGTAQLIGIVDDDEGIRRALDGLLRSAGYRVVTFPSAEALLGSTCLETLACLVLDLHLPGMDGLRLQRRLAEDSRRIPIIVLTAHGDGDARTRALAGGAVALLAKPFDGELLLADITRALKRIP